MLASTLVCVCVVVAMVIADTTESGTNLVRVRARARARARVSEREERERTSRDVWEVCGCRRTSPSLLPSVQQAQPIPPQPKSLKHFDHYFPFVK
jgi:hypothetical protein